jgi:hypothetical protein
MTITESPRERTARSLVAHMQQVDLAPVRAAADERERFNAACADGARPIISTWSGRHVVTEVSARWWYTAYPEGQQPDELNTRRWLGRNDEVWADLLAQVGVERHPYFARHEQ